MANKILHIVFIDLEKTYDNVLCKTLLRALMRKEVSLKYINLIRDVYVDEVTYVKICDKVIDDFSIAKGLHQDKICESIPFHFDGRSA